MGNGHFGYRPTRFHLMDTQLHLDPDVVRMMQEVEARMASRQTLNQFLLPNWDRLMPSWESIVAEANARALTSPSPAPAGGPAYVPGAGPATPRAGELSDVTRAIYQLPAVQRLVLRAHDEGMQKLRLLGREWDSATPADRVTMVTMGGVVVGSSLAIVLANQQTRDLAFNLIKGHDIPIPGVDGLSFQLLDRGGSITAPLGVPGLTGSARVQLPSGAPPDYEFKVMFDVMVFVRSQR